MAETAKLLALFRVDKQIRGLTARLTDAERFLTEQRGHLERMETKTRAIDAQLRQLRAAIANEEGEAARLEERINVLREQMNAATTGKQYNAFLSEVNNLKKEKAEVEERVLDAMTKAEALEAQAGEIKGQHDERQGITRSAEGERDERQAEIKERLDELRTKREHLAKDVPDRHKSKLESLINQLGDDAMAEVEVIDRRNHEYSCGACMMALPIESVNALLSGSLTTCVSCGAILYTEEDILAKRTGKRGATADA